ncbi:MAG: phytoene/squalene synthase family protein, partial [Pseudomonadota bacterium]
HELLRCGLNSIDVRTVVPPARKMALTARSLLPPPANRAHLLAEPLPQVRYLIRAVGAQELPHTTLIKPSGLSSDIDWVMNVFAELERRDRLKHSPGPSAVHRPAL